MKKMIIAAAVASILAPATVLADTTLYGALRMSAVSGETQASTAGSTATDIGGVVNNASRIGLKGSYGEEGGLTGFFHIQAGADTDTGSTAAFSSRFAFAGVKGGFGKVVMGRLSSPYKMAGLKVDPFYDTSAGPTDSGSNFGLSSLTNGFLNNVVGYVSPKLGGSVTVNAVAVLDKNDNGTTATADNMYNIGATYSANGLTASVQHITELDATRVTAGYKTGAFGVGLSYETIDNRDGDSTTTDDQTQMYLSGTYKVAPKTTLAASYGKVEDNGGVATGTGLRDSAGDGYSIGVFHKVASKTTVSAMYSDVDYDAAAGLDRSVFAIGLVQKF